MGDHNDQFNSKGRNVCLDAGDNCVISVDWSALTPTNCFNQSARNTPVVGNCTANLIVTIMSCTSISSDQFNVKGFSFGARICEWVAQRLKPNGIKLERMTKIEPSKRFPGDSFVPQDSSSQQNSTDAKWVDCHHTASGFRSQIEPCGHADCYWNNGQSQPICAGLDNNAFYDHACSHVVGYEYYWSSYNYPFLGRKCEYDDGLPLENCTTETVRAGWFMPNGTVGQYNVSTALMPQNLINQMNRTVLC
ncbi:lipase member I-like [Chrysoperla carnea]|uniref:lipase member I-like n=1 Tax=Chrysoperla carnea TaxID=189513 RepID=UPI001D08605C|nr:lipase member I-like [Chrysoperla carnea]